MPIFPALTTGAFKPWRIAAVTFSALASLGVSLDGAFAWQPETLRDISRLQVQVEKDCQAGASASRLREGIEAYLSREGIPIDTNRSSSGIRPHLYLDIFCGRNGDFAFGITARVYQPVVLNGRTIEAATYSAGGIFGVANSVTYANNESNTIISVLDQFISDWHSAR